MDLVLQYLNYIQYERCYSPHTVISYRKHLKDYKEVLDFYEVGFLEATRIQAREFVRIWGEKNLSAKTVNNKIKAVRSFYKYCIKQGLIKGSPFYTIPLLKEKKHHPFYFVEPFYITNVIDRINPGGCPVLWQHKAIFETLYCTGIRVSELIGIKIEDLDFYTGSFKVLGKGNKERHVFMLPRLKTLLWEYLKVIDRREGYLFVSKRVNRIYPVYVHRLIKNYFPKMASAHSFRHSFATHLLENGAPIAGIQGLMGHTCLLATSHYLHYNRTDIKNVFNLAHPKA